MMKEKIIQITSDSISQKWPFPKTYGELKNLGLRTYTVNCSNTQMVYEWDGGKYIKETGMVFHVSGQFTSQAIKHEINVHNRDKTSYMDFMNGIVKNGCTHYVVEFNNNRVVYYGASENEKHIEYVPGY